MFNERLLESSEFYTKRYQNFTTLIIFPTLILLVLLILLACLTHKETVIKSTGEIAPIKILRTIQSTSNNPIIKNELLTKKEITAGDILIQYQNTESDTNLQLQKSSLKNLQEHVQALIIYKDSIKQNQNLFTDDDNLVVPLHTKVIFLNVAVCLQTINNKSMTKIASNSKK
ncbi:hypothetical protein ACMDB6_00415 [Leuconostoc mesenteroides]|uniref:hypothetical protein n=1 Tax=Leuconostoc mesenteroides TaxID=1245 RepID=UPI0035259EF6